MARMTVTAGAVYLEKLSALAEGSREIAEKAVYEASGIVADEIRENLIRNLAQSEQSTGALLDSLGIAPITVDKNGYIGTKIGFDGYDDRGVPNQLKARVMESGSSTIAPRPFVRPAVKATKKMAEETMNRVIEEELDKIMKG